MTGLIRYLAKRSKAFLVAMAFSLVAVVGVTDYLTGAEISYSIFYLIPISLSGWFVGRRLGVLVSFVGALCWLWADLAAGATYSHPLIPFWNAAMRLGVFLIVTWLLAKLKGLHSGLEEMVRQRTAALAAEIAERRRLERELLEICDRERREVGQNLHDGPCQQLMGAAIASSSLEEKLTLDLSTEAVRAKEINQLVTEAIAQCRDLARGLYPAVLETEGLEAALWRMASSVAELFHITCRFVCEKPVPIHEPTLAQHLYRIGQEAVNNAIKHGKPSNVLIALTSTDGQVILIVKDDGVGIAQSSAIKGGMGLRIMAFRAELIGATLDIQRDADGGTLVTCTAPNLGGTPQVPGEEVNHVENAAQAADGKD